MPVFMLWYWIGVGCEQPQWERRRLMQGWRPVSGKVWLIVIYGVGVDCMLLLTLLLQEIILYPTYNSYPQLQYKFKPQMQTAPSSLSIVLKITAMLVLTLLQLILNSFVQASFSLSSQSIFYINFYFIPIQIVVTAGIFIMMLIMMWQTFPLRYGLVARLFREFRWTFLVVLAFICLTAAERGLKLSFVISELNTFDEQLLFNDRAYVALYYVRFFLYPVFYAVLISFSLRIIDPIFYKPNKWLN